MSADSFRATRFTRQPRTVMVKQRPDFITHSDRTKGVIMRRRFIHQQWSLKDYAIAAGFADGLPLLSFMVTVSGISSPFLSFTA